MNGAIQTEQDFNMKTNSTPKPIRNLTTSTHEELLAKIQSLPTKPSAAIGCQLVRRTLSGRVLVACAGTCPSRKTCTLRLILAPQPGPKPPFWLGCVCQ
jgi:hypothetical protein